MNTAYVHVGLRAVKQAFGAEDPYRYLIGSLQRAFGSVLAPGITTSFRISGIYHKLFSRPEHGAFTARFLNDCDDRTDDCIHSILIKGSYRFDGCDHTDSFGPESCFACLDRDDVLYVNIGTPLLVCTQLHYIENLCDAPYIEKRPYEGVLYTDETHFRRVRQLSFRYRRSVEWNRLKLERDLIRSSVLERHDLNGLIVRFFRARELREYVQARLERNPYYLVT